MPLSRNTITNEYSLGGGELYHKAHYNEPEDILEGVAMAGLVGVLRQLGDLAEFAAEVFSGLHDEVMNAATRGHGLMLRARQLEAELPLIEKDSCQKDYLYVASNRGVDLHANLKVDHGLVTRGDMPHFIMESMKQCHGPPKLFMLDKYDIGGEGACLKRYTDPSFFQTGSACSSMLLEGIQREKRPLKAMEIRPDLQNYEIFRLQSTANNENKFEMDVSGEASNEVPSRRRRLKYRQLNGSVLRSLRPDMQSFYGKASSEKAPSMDQSEVQISFTDSPDTDTEVRDIAVDAYGDTEKGKDDHCNTVHVDGPVCDGALSHSSYTQISAGSSKGYTSEVDIYVDALATMESEVETDSEPRDRRHCAFTQIEPGKTCSDAQNAASSRSSSFRKKDSPTPYYLDAASANGNKTDHHPEDVGASILQAKPVAGEHERTCSLEELLTQEKPVSCEHERTSSLEELLAGDVFISEPGMKEPATESNSSGTVSNVTSNGTIGSTKKAKENSNIATISFKKAASKRSRYMGSVELIALKVGILPRKLSKKQDPFSDSLRNMAKQLLELKYDGTQDTNSYDFEPNGEEYNVKCAMDKVPFDSARDNVGSRECQPEEVKEESEHSAAPAGSLQDSVPHGNGIQDIDTVYLMDTASPSFEEEEVCAVASAVHSSPDTLDNELPNRPIQIEANYKGEVPKDAYTAVASEDTSDLGEEEGKIYNEQTNLEDAEECNESDGYALDDQSTEYIEEQVVLDGVISSPSSSKHSDDPCQITRLALTDADASKSTANCIPETEHIPSSETTTETDLPTVVTDQLEVSNDAAVPDNEQCYSHPETTVLQNTNSYESVNQHEQSPPCCSSTIDATPATDCTKELYELHQLMHQGATYICNSGTAEICGDALAPDSRDLPLSNISSFAWMLNGAMQESFNVQSGEPAYGIVQENSCSRDTEDAPPLPPLPPMQWRAAKLQTGFAKLGRPPRPKPPVKDHASENSTSPGARNQEAEKVQEQHDDLTLHKEMAQRSVFDEKKHANISHGNEICTNEEIHIYEGFGKYDELQASIPFSASENKSSANVSSVEGKNLKSLELPELTVIPEEVWSELAEIKPTQEEELSMQREGKHQLSNEVSDLSTEMLKKEYENSDQKGKEVSTADSSTMPSSEVNKPSNGAPAQNDVQSTNLSVQQEEKECASSDCKESEFSSAIEQPAMLPPQVSSPLGYPLLKVTTHDRSMLRKAPTLIQPSSKLSDERNTLLEQIRNKSYNLKPVLAKRPNVMGGPRTNLKVVSILERANAIRQAVSDDDDEDRWSD